MKTDKKIMIFAGNLESRQLVEALSEHMENIYAGVSELYGDNIPPGGNVTIISQILDKEKMVSWISRVGIDIVVDATHPYALDIRRDIQNACEETGTQYFRLIQPVTEKKDAIYFNEIQEAVEFLQGKLGNVFITANYNELHKFTAIPGYEKKLFFRIPVEVEALKTCMEAGLSPNQIVCMNGPYSDEMNVLQLKEAKAAFLVTQEEDISVDFSGKMNAAKATDCTVLIVGQPVHERGYFIEELWPLLVTKLGI